MAVRFTRQGCKVETTYTIQPNGTFTEEIVLSVDPTSKLSVLIEERASLSLDEYILAPKKLKPKPKAGK